MTALPLSDLHCVCPCHETSKFQQTHIIPCCCPHRHVVVDDCPECNVLREQDAISKHGECRHYDGLTLL